MRIDDALPAKRRHKHAVRLPLRSSKPRASLAKLAMPCAEGPRAFSPKGGGAAFGRAADYICQLRLEALRHGLSKLFTTASLRRLPMLAVLMLITGCASHEEKMPLLTLYMDASDQPIPEDNYSRVFMHRLAQNHVETLPRDQIMLCGPVKKSHRQHLTPGLTIAAAIRQAGAPKDMSLNIYMAGLWRAKDGVLYGVKFDEQSHPHPKKHVLNGTDLVQAGDAVVVIERIVYF